MIKIITKPIFQTHPFRPNIATGFMESSVMRLHVPDIGPVGMEQQQNNSVLEDFYTMKKHTPVIGHRTLLDARNIVSYFFVYLFLYNFGFFYIEKSG